VFQVYLDETWICEQYNTFNEKPTKKRDFRFSNRADSGAAS